MANAGKAENRPVMAVWYEVLIASRIPMDRSSSSRWRHVPRLAVCVGKTNASRVCRA